MTESHLRFARLSASTAVNPAAQNSALLAIHRWKSAYRLPNPTRFARLRFVLVVALQSEAGWAQSYHWLQSLPPAHLPHDPSRTTIAMSRVLEQWRILYLPQFSLSREAPLVHLCLAVSLRRLVRPN